MISRVRHQGKGRGARKPGREEALRGVPASSRPPSVLLQWALLDALGCGLPVRPVSQGVLVCGADAHRDALPVGAWACCPEVLCPEHGVACRE